MLYVSHIYQSLVEKIYKDLDHLGVGSITIEFAEVLKQSSAELI